MRNCTAMLDFPIGVLEICRERVIWRPSSGDVATFDFEGGRWFQTDQTMVADAPPPSRAPPTLATHPRVSVDNSRPVILKAFTLLIAGSVVVWFLWDFARHRRPGDEAAPAATAAGGPADEGRGDDGPRGDSGRDSANALPRADAEGRPPTMPPEPRQDVREPDKAAAKPVRAPDAAPGERTYWYHARGYFENTQASEWSVFIRGDGEYALKEVGRNADYVELKDGATKTVTRLFRDRCEVRKFGKGEFEVLFVGGWTEKSLMARGAVRKETRPQADGKPSQPGPDLGEKPLGPRAIADDVRTIVEAGDMAGWTQIQHALDRTTGWILWRDQEIRRWKTISDRLAVAEKDVQELVGQRGVDKAAFEKLWKVVSRFGDENLPPDEAPWKASNDLWKALADVGDQPLSAANRKEASQGWGRPPAVEQMGRYPSALTRGQVRTLYAALQACKRSLDRCGKVGRAFEDLAELIPLEKVGAYPGQQLLLPPDGEVMAIFRFGGHPDWPLPERNHPALKQEFQSLVNLNLPKETFATYFKLLLTLHPYADSSPYSEAALKYSPAPGQRPRRFDGSTPVPSARLAENCRVLLAKFSKDASLKLTEFWWLDDDLDDESELQRLSYLMPSDDRRPFGLADGPFARAKLNRQQELADNRMRQRGSGGARFTDEELKEFQNRYVAWQLIGWRRRAWQQSNWEPAKFNISLEWWGETLKRYGG